MRTKIVWKDIPGYEGLYQVSNSGKFKRIYSINKGVYYISKGNILKPALMPNGYKIIGLRSNGKSKGHYAHRLVMLAFVGQSKLTVDHINGKRADNRLENLRYLTIRENIIAGITRRGGSLCKYVGVWKEKREYDLKKPYRASVWFNGKKIKLGYYKTAFQAHLAYRKKIKELTLS